ncbi:MAG TPA: hypothetical protein VHM70_20235 [Polyangiaceae bacterium]|jgi:hypothetical protein|nr:hypothetical protein [Polyangiaceae bacterium]
MQAANGEVDAEFGALVAEYGAGWTPRIALYFLIALLGGMFVIVGISSKQDSVVVSAVLATAALCGLVHFALACVRLRIFERGVERRGRLGTKRLAWSQLQNYQLELRDPAVAAAGASGGLVGVLAARLIRRMINKKGVPSRVVLIASDGSKVVLSNVIRSYKEWIEALVAETTERLFTSTKLRFDNGEVISFGSKLSVQREAGISVKGAFGKTQVLTLDTAASAVVEGPLLVIRRSDSNAVWRNVDASSVLNIGVFQKLLAAYGKPYVEAVPMAWTT